MLGRRRHFVERAVHAVADLEFVFERFEMNVARAVLHRLEEDQVHEADDGRFVGQVHFGAVVSDSCRFCRLPWQIADPPVP